MGTAYGGFRSADKRGIRGEPMAGANTAVRAHGLRGVLSDIAAYPRIKPLIPPWVSPLPVRGRPGPHPTARPRAGARDGAGPWPAVRPRSGARGKEGGPV
jgi:hypothetical protein